MRKSLMFLVLVSMVLTVGLASAQISMPGVNGGDGRDDVPVFVDIPPQQFVQGVPYETFQVDQSQGYVFFFGLQPTPPAIDLWVLNDRNDKVIKERFGGRFPFSYETAYIQTSVAVLPLPSSLPQSGPPRIPVFSFQ